MIETENDRSDCEREIEVLKAKISALTEHLDRMYMDRLSGMLEEVDFSRIYLRAKEERRNLESQMVELSKQIEQPVSQDEQARVLVSRFLDSGFACRELLVSLIERIELTQDKQIIIHFRFRQLDEVR